MNELFTGTGVMFGYPAEWAAIFITYHYISVEFAKLYQEI